MVRTRSLELKQGDWQQLERLAVVTNSLARRGPKSGQPSWRALMRRIARRDLAVMSRGQLEQIVNLAQDPLGELVDVSDDEIDNAALERIAQILSEIHTDLGGK